MKVKYKIKDERTIRIPEHKIGFVVRFNEKCEPDETRFNQVLSRLYSMGFTWHYNVEPARVEDYRGQSTGLGIKKFSGKKYLVWSDEPVWEEEGFITISYGDFMNRKVTIETNNEDSL